jgi:hypothetical protein
MVIPLGATLAGAEGLFRRTTMPEFKRQFLERARIAANARRIADQRRTLQELLEWEAKYPPTDPVQRAADWIARGGDVVRP